VPANALLPSGEFISPQFDANVYTNATPRNVKAIGDADVKLKDGKAVLIRDVATVEDGGSPATQDVTIDSTPGVYLNVLRVPGSNTLAIVDQAKAIVKSIQANLPSGMHVKAIFDQSTFVRTAYDGLKTEVWWTLLLIALVILVFLQSVRGTLIVAVANSGGSGWNRSGLIGCRARFFDYCAHGHVDGRGYRRLQRHSHG